MANARTRYDTIVDYMVRAHDASAGRLYGKPCVMLHGHAFVCFAFEGTAFKLHGRVRLQASTLRGARYWNPVPNGGPSMEWVMVPEEHFLRWDRLAIEALRCQKEGSVLQRVAATTAPEGPPKPPPAAQRWINSISSLLAKAAGLKLSAREAPKPAAPASPLLAAMTASIESGKSPPR